MSFNVTLNLEIILFAKNRWLLYKMPALELLINSTAALSIMYDKYHCGHQIVLCIIVNK